MNENYNGSKQLPKIGVREYERVSYVEKRYREYYDAGRYSKALEVAVENYSIAHKIKNTAKYDSDTEQKWLKRIERVNLEATDLYSRHPGISEARDYARVKEDIINDSRSGKIDAGLEKILTN